MNFRVLLICPHSAMEIFKESKISVAIPHIPYVSLASLAGMLLAHGQTVKILDLTVSLDPFKDLEESLLGFRPDFVGITFTTGLCQEAAELVQTIKKINPLIKTIAGGVHTSIFPQEVIKEYGFDFAVVGEGEITLLELVSGKELLEIDGLAFKNNDGCIILNQPRKLIENLDFLPYPAFYLYNPKNYHSPRITVSKSPAIAIETSRGCPGNCVFCNKTIFQNNFRKKSAFRVVDEMEIVLNLGYREIHIWDDCFSADINHAKGVCEEIIRRKLKVNWSVYNGLRVDRVDEELLKKLKMAGCYRISYGIESGDQEILNRSRKGITLAQIKKAVFLAKEAGLETIGFFMIGLPGETPASIQKTINFVKELDLDLPKVSIATPLPGTDFFREWQESGLILSVHWPDYVFHSVKRIALYPGLSQDIFKYYNLFWRQVYLRPRFIAKRFWRGVKTGEIFYDFYYFLKIFLKFKW